MPYLKVFTIVFPVFSIIGLGYLFAAFKRIDLDSIIETLLYITIPALVISSLLKKKIMPSEFGIVSAAAITVVLGTGLMAFIFLSAIKRKELRGFYLPTMFMNSGNMAFPLALLTFGKEGLSIAVIYYVTVGLLVYSIGIYIAKGRGGWSEMFKLPLLYAAILGIALNISDTAPPTYIFETVDILGNATIPLMLLSLGYRLYSIHLGLFWLSVSGAIIRIIGGGIIAFSFVKLIGIGGLDRDIIILTSTMPSAVINFIVSHRYKIDSNLVASIVALSSFISVITTPLILIFLLSRY